MTFLWQHQDASSLAFASLIAKFRAKVSKFPVLEAKAASSTHATGKSHFLLLACCNERAYKSMTFLQQHQNASSLAFASLIAKFRAQVSKFLVLEAELASSTRATAKSHFLLGTCRNERTFGSMVFREIVSFAISRKFFCVYLHFLQTLLQFNY